MSEQKPSGTKRIHRAKDKEQIISALMGEQVGIFKEIWRLLVFASQIGMRDKQREPLASVDSGKGIDQTTFGNCTTWPGISYLMSLVEEDSSDALAGSASAEDARIALFEEYANGGLAILESYFSDRVIDLDGILSFIAEKSSKGTQDVDLDLAI